MNPIAKRIHEERIKAGLTEKELAKKCGLAAAYIIQIESGKKIINENAAAAILAVFGETMETSYNAYIEEIESAPIKTVPVKASLKAAVPAKSIIHETLQVEPNAQWTGALANIIKRFQVIDVRSGKVVGLKELPVLNRKIEDIPWEKLLFFGASDDDASGLRIRKGDILWVQEMKTVQAEGIYLIERQNRKQFCRIQKQTGRLVLSQGIPDPKPVTVEAKDIQVIGRCVRVEFLM